MMLSTKVNGVKLNILNESFVGELLPKYTISFIKFNENIAALIELLSRGATDLPKLKTMVEDDTLDYESIYAIVKIAHTIGMHRHLLAVLGELSSAVTADFYIRRAKYMHSIMLLMPELVDFKAYFIHGIYPYSSLAGAATLPMYSTVEARKELNDFYFNFNIKALFDTFGTTENEIINSRMKEREEIMDYNAFDLNTFSEADPKYFNFGERVTGKDIWDCGKVSLFKDRKEGEVIYVSVSEFRRRFGEYTYGYMEKSPNPDQAGYTFNWEGVCVAGGSVEQCMLASYRPSKNSDVDIFVYGSTYKKKKEITNRLIEWFSSPKTYFGIVGSIVYVYILDCPRVFQIISSDHSNVFSVINDFDISPCKYAYFSPKSAYNMEDAGRTIHTFQVGDTDLFECTPFKGVLTVIASYDAIQSAITGVSKIAKDSRTSADRILKYMKRGYSFESNETVLEDFDIISMIESNNHVYKELVQSLNVHWFPRSSDIEGLPEEEAVDMINGMIKKMSKSTMTTNKPYEVRENLTYAGNFISDYTRVQWSNFRITNIKNLRQERRTKKYLQGIANRIQILTAPGKIVKFHTNEDDVIFSVLYTDRKFIEFINDTLENKTLKLVTQLDVTKPLLVDNVIEYQMKAQNIRAREDRNIVVSRRSNGEPINTFEDLIVGQEIQVMVHIHLESDNNGERKFTLCPSKILLIEDNKEPVVAMNEGDDDEDNEDNEDDEDDDAPGNPEDKKKATLDQIDTAVKNLDNTILKVSEAKPAMFTQLSFD